RLFTYARGESLSEAQLAALQQEGAESPRLRIPDLALAFRKQVDLALDELRDADQSMLTSHRSVGRSKLPSTMLGLYVHAAEHTQRHVGQLLVTVRVQRG